MNTEANGRDDEDCLFLEKVLDKLYDFGNKSATKKQSKKKKRKRCEEDDPENDCSDDNEAGHQHQQSRPEQPDHLIQQNQVEVVTFQDPRKKLKTKQTPVPENTPFQSLQTKEKKHKEQSEELSLEKARLEVHRFGITGYEKEEQRVFEQDRAVMLGARPPKKEYVNYKLLQEQRKEKKKKEKEEVHPDLKKKKKKQNNPRDKRKATPSGSGSAPSGQVGRFKNGMLILSTKEIQKIKGSKGGRR